MNQKKIMKWCRTNLSDMVPFIALIVVFLLFALTTQGRFAKFRNLGLIIAQSVLYMLAGLGSTFSMSHGNLDFAQGGVLMIACLLGYLATKLNPLFLVPVCILTAIAVEIIICVMNLSFNIPTFVLGISMMFVGQGVIRVAQNIEFTMMTPSMYSVLDSRIFYVVLIAVSVAIAFFFFEKTKLGKCNKLIGSSSKAAFLSGIPVSKFKMLAFLVAGICMGLASFSYMLRVGSVSRQTGSMLQVQVLICLVLGGMSLNGGSNARIRMIVIGGLIYSMLSNGLVIWGLNPHVINIIQAVVFLITVALTYDRDIGYIA